MTKRLKRPRDPAQLAKLIMDIATGEVKDMVADKRSPVAVERSVVHFGALKFAIDFSIDSMYKRRASGFSPLLVALVLSR